jgi:predicted DNA-binding ribbon-helix-helix protein
VARSEEQPSCSARAFWFASDCINLCDFCNAPSFFLSGHSTGRLFCLDVAFIQLGDTMKSSVVKRSIIIAGHKTSISLEDAFWKKLKEIARERDMTVSDLVGRVNSERQLGNLSSAIRLFVLGFYCDQICEYEGREMVVNATVSTSPTH